MVVIRKAIISKLSCLLAVAAMASLDVAPAQAQQYAGTRNSKQGTIGDLSASKLSSRVERVHNLRFGTMGLFVDAGADDPFRPFEIPNPFIYALPNFSGAGLNFDGMTFDEYLTLVANSYENTNSGEYLSGFAFRNASAFNGELLFPNSPSLLNEFNVRNDNQLDQFRDQFGVSDLNDLPPEILPFVNDQYQQFRSSLFQELEGRALLRLHEEDFLAGGGYLPLPTDTVTPVIPVEEPTEPTEPTEPPVFDPFPTGTDTSAATLLENSGVLSGDDLTGALDILNQAGGSQSESQASSQSAPAASTVPEPTTLGLLVAAGTALIGRRRR